MSTAAAFDRSLIAAEVAHFAGFQPRTESACVEDRAGRAAAPVARCARVAAAIAAYDVADRAANDAKGDYFDAPSATTAAARDAAFAVRDAAAREVDAAGKAARAAGRPL